MAAFQPKTRALRVSLTLSVRDMTGAEYEDAMEGAEEYFDGEGDPRDVVSTLDATELRDVVTYALNSEGNPELFAGTSIFAVMGDATTESIEWVPEALPIAGHPSIAPKLTAEEWPTWAEIDAFVAAHPGDQLAAKVVRAAHRGMMHGPEGLRLLYDIRHAMGWSNLHSLDILPAGIAEMRKSYLWGDIRWAPRDGTHVLVKFEGTSTPPTVAHWFEAADGDADGSGWFLSVQQHAGPAIHPTHYQRLPAEKRP